MFIVDLPASENSPRSLSRIDELRRLVYSLDVVAWCFWGLATCLFYRLGGYPRTSRSQRLPVHMRRAKETSEPCLRLNVAVRVSLFIPAANPVVRLFQSDCWWG